MGIYIVISALESKLAHSSKLKVGTPHESAIALGEKLLCI